jgi:SulP family sulfate permease
VAVTGEVPTGLFTVGVPDIDASELFTLFVGALAIVFVGYSETLAAARSVAARHGDEVDADQELIAQGAACGVAGLVGGFASDGSLSKTSVADTAGQRTQMASLINAALILLTMLLLAGLFETLPGATLGAVVIDAMIGLITLREVRRYFKVNRADWVFAMAAGVGILCLGITQGILIGVVLSLLLLVWRSSHTSVRELRPEPASGVFHDVTRHDALEPVPGILVARVDGPLFFADAEHFRAKVHELTAARSGVTGVVVDAEAIFLTDTDGADILSQVARELAAREIAVVLAAPHPPVLDLWSRAGVLAAIGDDAVHATVGRAVETLAQRRAARPTSPPTSTPITVTR